MAMRRINGSSSSPPSTSWQSGNQPGRLEASKVSMVSNMADETAQRGGLAREGSRAPGSINIPFKLMTSRIVDDLEPDERCDKKRSKKQGGDGWSAWSSRNGLLVKREERGRAAFCCGLVYQSPAPAALPAAPASPYPIQPTSRVSSPTFCFAANNLHKEAILYQAVLLKFAVDLFIWINAPTETINQFCSLVASDSSMMLLLPILSFICLAVPAIANVEKTIFTAPESANFGDARPNLSNLRLDILSLERLSIRTALPVIFPTEKHPRGLSSWYTLNSLRPGQRYEVRICWAATVLSKRPGTLAVQLC